MRPLICLPSNVTVPAEAGWMRMMARPMVVLPEPDSPTSPNVSPSKMWKETPLTAVKGWRREPKRTVRLFTSSSFLRSALMPLPPSVRAGR